MEEAVGSKLVEITGKEQVGEKPKGMSGYRGCDVIQNTVDTT